MRLVAFFFARLFVCKITQNVVGGFQRNYHGWIVPETTGRLNHGVRGCTSFDFMVIAHERVGQNCERQPDSGL